LAQPDFPRRACVRIHVVGARTVTHRRALPWKPLVVLHLNQDLPGNIKLIEDPEKNFVVIMKNGKIYKITIEKEESRLNSTIASRDADR
jgi:hypothetical protein